ncbi:MAG TPA: FAD-dependent monooxygenase, partial [Spirochaetota bacterium]|nr:FAD-dependent monooxygenase [Spirochaetota bacterium]
RNKDSIFWSYNIAIEVDDLQGQALLQYYKEASPYIEQRESPLVKITKSTSVIIIGTGPAGLFCGLVLALSGVKVIFLERGCSVDERMGDIELLESSGLLNPESNVLFGEGGA